MELPARCQGVGQENYNSRTNPRQVDAGVAANIEYLPGDRRLGGLMSKRISSGAIGISAVLAVLATAYSVLERKAVVEAAGTQAPRFEVDPMWPKPLPNHWVMGNTIGVSVDAKDHIWIIHRQGSLEAMENYGAANPPGPKRQKGVVESECCVPAPPVLEFDEGGSLLAHWGGSDGDGYTWPDSNHGITVDYKGNVWIGGNGRGTAPGATAGAAGRGAAAAPLSTE